MSNLTRKEVPLLLLFSALKIRSTRPVILAFFKYKDASVTKVYGFVLGFEAVLQIIVSDEIEAHMLYDSVVPSEESFFLEDGIIFYVGTQDSKEF